MPPAKTRLKAADDEDRAALPEDAPARSALNIHPGTGALCRLCYPDGWPAGATGLGCKHGSWTRLPTGVV